MWLAGRFNYNLLGRLPPDSKVLIITSQADWKLG